MVTHDNLWHRHQKCCSARRPTRRSPRKPCEGSNSEISSLTPEEARLLENLLRKVKSHPDQATKEIEPPPRPTDQGRTG